MNVAIVGYRGKMGTVLSSLLEKDPLFSLKQTFSKNSSFEESLFEEIDLLFDFSLPAALFSYLKPCKEKKIPLVIGTTGFSFEKKNLIEKAAKEIPIFYAANFSIGIALLASFVRKTASFFPKSSIFEKHHIHKKDSPSGTALFLQKEIASITASPSISSLREGEVFGEHTLFFTTEEESISLHHSALNREVFAKGALLAAHFLVQKPVGLYTMKDLVNI